MSFYQNNPKKRNSPALRLFRSTVDNKGTISPAFSSPFPSYSSLPSVRTTSPLGMNMGDITVLPLSLIHI